jgi:hypothetical protein
MVSLFLGTAVEVLHVERDYQASGLSSSRRLDAPGHMVDSAPMAKSRRLSLAPKSDTPLPPTVREALRWLAARAASAGGKARWEGVSAADRSAHAKKAVAAREAKRRGTKKKAGR